MAAGRRGRPRSAPDLAADVDIFLVEIPVPREQDIGIFLKAGRSENGVDLGVVVGGITPGSPADRYGRLAVDDLILSVNDQSLDGVPNVRAVSLLKRAVAAGKVKLLIGRPLRKEHSSNISEYSDDQTITSSEASVRRVPTRRRARKLPEKPPATPRTQAAATAVARQDQPAQVQTVSGGTAEPQRERRQHFVRVVLTGQGLRLGIVQSPDSRDYALRVAPDGDGARAGLANDMIVKAINGRSIDHLDADEIEQELTAISHKTALNPMAVTLEPNGMPFGLTLSEEEPGFGVRISAILKGSLTAEDGRLEVGDVITRINGTSATNIRTAQVARIIKRCQTRKEPCSISVRRDTAAFLVTLPPYADSSHYETSSASEAEDVRHRRSPRRSTGRGRPVPLSEIFEHMGGALTPSQKEMVKRQLVPDKDGRVDSDAVKYAVQMAMEDSQTESEATESVISADETSDEGGPQGPYSFRLMQRRLRTLTQQNQLLKQQLDESNERIRLLEAEKNDAVTSARLTGEAQTHSRKVEDDYEEIVALLEAEIAHLRAQLQSGPDKKDAILIALRQRVLVLGVQLNKAISAKNNLQTVCDKLREFVDRTQRRLSYAGMNKMSADRILAVRGDGTLLYRPSDGRLPPSAPWIVGDQCLAPCSLHQGQPTPATIEEINGDNRTAQVKFQEYEGLPLTETVNMSALFPLPASDHFVVESARSGDLARRVGGTTDPTLFLSPSEKAIMEDCSATSQEVTRILETQPLPFGWEEAYTAAGVKYYINHATQTTQWTHPVSKVDYALDQLQLLPQASA
eukprot:m.230854 g.230854  ORF g.230854 m.230854 type:complete len:801 (+) comp17061_c0_seq12:244-2646(+)